MKKIITAFAAGIIACSCANETYYEKTVRFPEGATLEEKIDIAAHVVPTPEQLKWQSLELTAFLHFGINTFTGNEWGDGTDSPELFNPSELDCRQWAHVLKVAGFTAAILTAKHHDGFCLYPSKYAWNWNSWDVGPHRDFCMELRQAMEGTGVKFGVYHSVYEWFHPLYLENPEAYALEHLHPMLKELICRYEPLTLFTDGEWEHESSVWHSTEFLQWLYNESSVKDYIVPNDRWGKETRGRKGGNFTTEYGIIDVYLGTERRIDDVDLDRPFEECRGIGRSFGINKEEGCEDYLSVKELLKISGVIK